MHSVPGSGHLVAGRYRLVDQIGRGAMGVVWRGHDQLLDREVAVKQLVLSPLASQTQAEASFQRTLREARTAARLSHPSVATVFDVVEENGAPWIVMELIHARPLDQVIAEDGPLPPARAAQLGLTLLDALATAHASGVLHRDVKPSNVLIKPDGKAVLTDFGIATLQGDPGLTQAGMVVGTPGFAPPERIRGEAATPASDLWSLGATLYAAVEGRGPFDRAGGSAAIVASIATEPAPRAPSAGPLAPVIEALLQADPAERPDAAGSARMLADAWAAARLPDSAMRRAHADLAGSPGPGQVSVEATTATQIVTVPSEVDRPGDPAEADGAATRQAGIGATDSCELDQAADLVRAFGGTAARAKLAASASRSPAGSAPPPASGATSVVPDLMATPVFADLKMPEPSGPAGGPPWPGDDSPASAAGAPAGADGSPGQARLGGPAPLRRAASRRGLVIVAPLVVIAIVTGIATLALHGFPTSLGQRLDNQAQGGHSHDAGGPAGHSPAHQRGSGAPHRGGTPGEGTPTGPSPTGNPSSPGSHSTSPEPTPTKSPSRSPSPTPTPTPTPPVGDAWYTVPASSIGVTAGFRLAAPAGWILTPGLNSTIRPAPWTMHLNVNMAPFAVQGPVREAHHLQAAAILHHTYRAYHLVSILAITFHGRPAALWSFWFKPNPLGKAIDSTKLIYTAITSAGPQPYIVSITAPAPNASAASHVFSVATRTFKPQP